MADEIKHCERHNRDYTNAYCMECEEEYALSGRYQSFLEAALRVPTLAELKAANPEEPDGR